MFVQIENKDGLIRDMSSGAILNTNKTDYENFLSKKRQAALAKEAAARHEDDINNLKSDMIEIKQMLAALLQK